MVATKMTPPVVFQPPTGPQQFGGIIEPHTAFGARMQMTYREDDFDLDYHRSEDLNIDVEQMYWAPWADMTVLFDRFDRYTMRLGHSRKRPDLHFEMFAPPMAPLDCTLRCESLWSSLSTDFAANVLPNSE